MVKAHSSDSQADNKLLTILVTLAIPLTYLSGAWTSPLMFDPMLTKSAIAEIYCSGLLVAWLWLSRKEGISFSWRSPVFLIFGSLFLFATLSGLWAQNFDFFVDAWLKWYCMAITFIIALQLAKSPSNILLAITIVVGSATAVAIIGLGQYYLGWDFLPQRTVPSSTFSNANMAGHVTVMAVPLCILLIVGTNASRLFRSCSSIALVLLLLFAFHIKATGTWFAISVACLAVLTLLLLHAETRRTFFNRKVVIVGLSIIFVGGVTFFASSASDRAIQEVSNSVAELTKTEITTGTRRDIWLGALQIIKQSPILGVGLGNYYEVWSNGGFIQHYNLLGIQRVHNDFLELTVDLGIVGLALLLSCFIILLKKFLQAYRDAKDDALLIYILLVSCLAGFAASAFTSFPLQVIAPMVSIALVAGFIVGASPSEEEKRFHLSTRVIRDICLPVSVVLFLIANVLNYQWLTAIDELSKKYDDGSQLTQWNPGTALMNPNLINPIRTVVVGNLRYGGIRQANSFSETLLDFWTDEPYNLLLATEVNIALDRLENAESFAIKLRSLQPQDSLAAEHYLLHIYSKQANEAGLRRVYLDMKEAAPDLLDSEARHLLVLHVLSILFDDDGVTRDFYDRHRQLYCCDYLLEANMAIDRAVAGDINQAKQHAAFASQNPNLRLRSSLRQILSASETSELDQLTLFISEVLERPESEPALGIFR